MKSKLRLNLDQLSVESFAIPGVDDGAGTVRAHVVPPREEEPASDYQGYCGTNYVSCNGSCASCVQTCWNTCAETCASCVYTCQLSCHSVCHEPAPTNNCYV